MFVVHVFMVLVQVENDDLRREVVPVRTHSHHHHTSRLQLSTCSTYFQSHGGGEGGGVPNV